METTINPPHPTMRRHGLADRYLFGHTGIAIGESVHNAYDLPNVTYVDYCDESVDNEWHVVDEQLSGRRHSVDVIAEADCLPFEDSSYDFILNSHVLEHLPNAVKAVREWVRVVRPGGILFIVIPHIDGWASHPTDQGKQPTLMEHFQDDLDRDYTTDTHPREDGVELRGHLHRWTYDGFKQFIRRYFSDTLKHIDGEEFDQKCQGAGHTHVLRVVKPAANGERTDPIQPTRTRIWVNWPDTTGCTFYRAGVAALHLAPELAEIGIDYHSGGNVGGVPLDASHDIYWFQRSTSPDVLIFLHWLKKSGRTIVWDLDDDFFDIPKWSPAYKNVRSDGSLQTLPVCLDIADYITVTNQTLADRLADRFDHLAGRFTVLPNLVDHTRYEPCVPPPGRRPRIMWTGSDFHRADLDMIAPLIERIVAETDWEFVFVGGMTPKVRPLPPGRVWQCAGADIRYYPRLLCEIAADVALIPVTGSTFDECKSAIKWMECSLSGASVVASDWGPYRAAIEHGKTGLLVPNDMDAWFDAVKTALDHRFELHRAAREEVIARHSWVSPGRDLWKNFFLKVASGVSRV